MVHRLSPVRDHGRELHRPGRDFLRQSRSCSGTSVCRHRTPASSWGRSGWVMPLTTLIGGFAVDRYGARLVLTVAAVLWSLSIGATACASGFAMLYAARVLLGVSEGPNFPALTGAVSHWLPPHERTTALANAPLQSPWRSRSAAPSSHSELAGMTCDLRGPARRFARVGPAVVFSVSRRPCRLPLRECGGAGPYPLGRIARRRQASRGPLKTWPTARSLKTLLTNRTLVANYWAFFVFGYFLFFFMSWLPTIPEAEIWPRPADHRSVLRAALGVRGRRPVAARSIVRPSSGDDGSPARRTLLSHRRQPVHCGSGRHSRGTDRQLSALPSRASRWRLPPPWVRMPPTMR